MTINVKILSGDGSGRDAYISEDNAILTQDIGLPPKDVAARARIYRQYLTDDGTSTGSTDMRVNGSSTAVEFWISADTTYDLYISTLSFVIADASATLNNFGNITALTNGCDLEYFAEAGTITIANQLKSNFDFVRTCQGNPAFGDGAAAFRANNVQGTSEGYIPVLDFQKVFGLPWGIKLRPGTTDKLILRVNDNVTGVDAFNCIAFGYTRI